MVQILTLIEWNNSNYTSSGMVTNLAKDHSNFTNENIVSPEKKISNNWKLESRYNQTSQRRLKRSPSDKYAVLDSQLTDSKSTVSGKSKIMFVQHLRSKLKREDIFKAITEADVYVFLVNQLGFHRGQNQETEESRKLMQKKLISFGAQSK